ncbi:hypothetical protein BSZ36_00130 [Rubricoccus marinus]|uniref:Secretion system C-terminal sorting domain-containing protein n=2 Tax=Rubricoccus marinus TaxID=716817 RepID=A0A259TV09_9BACT|nr:hypothetical protein BSZ36_00130 [Rubricoccus marinus]
MDEKGRVYVYGQVTEPATGALYSIWRIGLDGRLDTAFGNGGYGLLAEDFFQYITTDGARLPDGSFILKGSHRRQAAFYKVTPEGLLDPSYGSNGIVFNGAGGSEDPFAVDAQGRVLQVRNRFGKAPDIIRYMVSGERDMTFGTDGAATVSHPDGVFNATEIRIGPQGRIFLAGDDGESQSQINAAHVARFLSDGQIDTSFGQGFGVARILIEGEEIGAISTAAVTDDGGVYLVGSRSRGRFSDFLALRTDSDGLHDMTWGEDGRVQLDLASSHDYGDVVDIDADGRVLIGGSIFAWDQENLRREIGLVRLLPMEPVAAGPQPPESSGALTLAPNPTRGPASVWLELSAPEARATVVVYDALGREVALLHDGPLAGGNHAFETPGGIAAGVYLVRASLGARAVTRAFTVVR